MREVFDPTKATYLSPPDNQKNFELPCFDWERYFKHYQDTQHFTSLLCNWILNVSQIIKKWKSNISIPINEKLVSEKLSYQEIISDIVLYQLITWEQDRSILLKSDMKSMWEIQSHNCLIFREWTYSIFDIGDNGFKLEENEIFRQIVYSLRELYDNKYLDEFNFYDCLFLSPEENNFINIWTQWFFQRMLSKVKEFLNRYDWEEWKDFFITQKKYSCPDEDNKKILDRYNNLIYTLKNIKKVISQDNIREKAIYEINTDYELVKEDFIQHLLKTKELFLQILNIFKNKVKKIIL